MGLTERPAEFLDPHRRDREEPLPPLGLLAADAFAPAELISLKQTAGVPVHLVFPVKEAAEAENLAALLAILQPLIPGIIDAGWLAFGGEEAGELAELPRKYPWLRLFPARRLPPPDQAGRPWGKGAVMRALLYHLIQSGQVVDPRAIIQFIDADIVPAYFHPNWCLGAVGAILWLQQVEAAKLVYFRPHGGRLNTFLRSLLAVVPHVGLQRLQNLIYLLSGEMAGTLKFWTSVPFKTGYGIEILILLSLALEQVGLHPDRSDLAQLAQVFVGDMDHRHAPLQSTRSQRGLDLMAGNVFHTVFETLEQAGVLAWPQGSVAPCQLFIPTPGTRPGWLETPVGEGTFPPLKHCPEVAARLTRTD